MESSPAAPALIVMLSRGGELDGAQRQLCYLACSLDPARHRPLVVLDSEGPTHALLQRFGVEVRVMPMRYWRKFPEALSRYSDAFGIAALARAHNAALVHASDLWKSPYALFVARRLGIPCVLHMRGPLGPRDIAKHGMKRAAAVIAIARRYRADLLAAGIPADRVHEVDDAVDVDHFRRDPESRMRLREQWQTGGRMAVGIVGRVEPFKRVVEFVETLGHLPAALRERTQVVIVGQDGPAEYMQHVRAAISRFSLDGQTLFTGRCDTMPAVLSALDVLATFSGGSVLFEAMACGTAIFSAFPPRRSSVHARHNETAWCSSAAETPEIAGALGALLEDAALRARLAETAHVWVMQHLGVETLARHTAAVYDRVLPAL